MELITSRHNSAIAAVQKLKRRESRDTLGLAFIEGQRLVSEALNALAERRPNVSIKSIYISKSFSGSNAFRAVKARADRYGIKQYLLTDDLFAVISDTVNPQGLMAVIGHFDYALRDLLSGPRGRGRLVLADRISDPGNLGAIVRTAEAAAFCGAAFSVDCADIYSPKAMRATMGSVLRLPFLREVSLYGLITEIKKIGYAVYATGAAGAVRKAGAARGDSAAGSAATAGSADGAGNAETANAVRYAGYAGGDCFKCDIRDGDVALVIGSEAAGVGEDIIGLCDAVFPQITTGGTVRFDRPGGRNVVGRHRIAERNEASRVLN